MSGILSTLGDFIMQGFGGPCCARILTAWFASKERGTYWGMWNIAHNLGGFSAPVQFHLLVFHPSPPMFVVPSLASTLRQLTSSLQLVSDILEPVSGITVQNSQDSVVVLLRVARCLPRRREFVPHRTSSTQNPISMMTEVRGPAQVLVGWAARRYGWRWGMWAPGAVGLTVGILLLLGVRDSPESVGYKPVEPVEKAKKVSCPAILLEHMWDCRTRHHTEHLVK